MPLKKTNIELAEQKILEERWQKFLETGEALSHDEMVDRVEELIARKAESRKSS